MKRLFLCISLFFLAFAANTAEMDDVGTITFPTSGSPEA